MKQTKTILVDDVDGSKADRTYSFTVNGVSYEIDLSDEHIEEFESDLAKWQSHARRTGGRASGGSGHSSRPKARGASESAKIRQWAHENDVKVSDRGRIPADIVELYTKATQA